MTDTNKAIHEELVEAFYLVINDFKLGIIDEDTLKERLFRLSERYERNIGKPRDDKQKGLF